MENEYITNESFNIYKLTKFGELQDVIKKHQIVVLKASAEWCQPCKKIRPLFDEFVTNIPDHISDIKQIGIVFIDIDEAIEIKRILRIRAVPFICNFMNGDIHDIVNSSSEESIYKFFAKTYDKMAHY